MPGPPRSTAAACRRLACRRLASGPPACPRRLSSPGKSALAPQILSGIASWMPERGGGAASVPVSKFADPTAIWPLQAAEHPQLDFSPLELYCAQQGPQWSVGGADNGKWWHHGHRSGVEAAVADAAARCAALRRCVAAVVLRPLGALGLSRGYHTLPHPTSRWLLYTDCKWPHSYADCRWLHVEVASRRGVTTVLLVSHGGMLRQVISTSRNT